MSRLRLFSVLGSVFILGMVFYLLEDILKPFVAAWILAYLLVPLVDLLDRYMPRWLAIVVSFLMIATVLSGLFLGLVPALHIQISAFLSQLPGYADQLNRAAGTLASHLHLKAHVSALGRGFDTCKGGASQGPRHGRGDLDGPPPVLRPQARSRRGCGEPRPPGLLPP